MWMVTPPSRTHTPIEAPCQWKRLFLSFKCGYFNDVFVFYIYISYFLFFNYKDSTGKAVQQAAVNTRLLTSKYRSYGKVKANTTFNVKNVFPENQGGNKTYLFERNVSLGNYIYLFIIFRADRTLHAESVLHLLRTYRYVYIIYKNLASHGFAVAQQFVEISI